MKTLAKAMAEQHGVDLFDYQIDALAAAADLTGMQRLCLYYKTGAGKTLTSLLCMVVWGRVDVLVICPPATQAAWGRVATGLGLNVECMSHAKFRMKDTKVSRHTAVIVDEFHLLGGHGGKGWKKMDTLALHLQAPLVILSATPNYNDAERVYCIQHVLDPHSCKGGYLQFLYQNCETEENPFGREPKVTGFLHHKDAAHYLSSLKQVQYLPDDLVYTIEDVPGPFSAPVEFYTYGYNERKNRIMASQIEERHALIDNSLINEDGLIWKYLFDKIEALVLGSTTPVLVFSNHSTVAEAMDRTMAARTSFKVATVTGSTPAKKKEARIQAFRDGVLDVLIGTATLATGTDGMDKVCDTLIILDDTDDASLRRQLIGRIMPRGLDTDATRKRVYRLVLQ